MAKILVVGDSIMAGHGGVTPPSNWFNFGSGHQIINAAVGGTLAAQWAGGAEGFVDMYNPDVIIFTMGGNDVLSGSATPSYTASVLMDAFINRVKARKPGLKVICLLYPKPDYNRKDANGNLCFPAASAQLAEQYRSAQYGYCVTKGIPHLDLQWCALDSATDWCGPTVLNAAGEGDNWWAHPDASGNQKLGNYISANKASIGL